MGVTFRRMGPQAQKAYDTLRERIASGILTPDEKLPPQAELAQNLGVALLTLRQAIAQLQDEGMLSSEQGRGTFVRKRLSALQNEALQETQNRVIELIARRRPLRDALDVLARCLEAHSDMLCSILLVAEDGECLRHGAAPSLPSEWLRATEEVPIGPSEGSCGTAAYRREQVVVRDTQTDPLWSNYRTLARKHSLRACWSTPIMSRDGVLLGTFALYYKAVREPDQCDLEFIERACQIATIALERHAQEQALRSSERRFRATVEEAVVGIAHNGLDGRWLYVNQTLCDMYGYTKDELRSITFQDLSFPADLAPDLAQLDRLVKGQISDYAIEKRLIRKDGSLFWAYVSLSLVEPADDSPYVLAFIHDISARKRAEEDLRGSEARLSEIVETNAVGMFIVDREGRYTLFNAAAERILGINRADILDPDYEPPPWKATSLSGDPLPDGLRPSSRTLSTGETVDGFEHVLQLPGDRTVGLSVSCAPLTNTAGQVVAAIVSFVDITDRVRALGAMRDSEERLHNLIQTSPDSIVSAGLDGVITMVNQCAVLMQGCESPADLIGKSLFDLFAPEDHLRARENARELLRTGKSRHNTEYRFSRRDGSEFPIELSSSIVFDADQRPAAVTLISRDISERKRAEAAFAHQALHDGLTGLPNRLLLNDRVEQAILVARREETGLALLLLDLDHFKDINDTFGHHYGDLLLRQVGPRLTKAVADSGTVARLGGDEFAIVLPGADAAAACVAAHKVLKSLELPFMLEGQTLDTGASIGIALFPDHSRDGNGLLRRADVAMYVAKRGTKPFAVYSPHHDRYTPARISLMSELRVAIEHDYLFLAYQPKVQLSDMSVRGVEALVRWQHPVRGIVPPGDFIQVAEQGGLIKPLSAWVLNRAVRQCRAWHAQGRALNVAVNLSARSLHDPQLVETMGWFLRKWDADPSWLELEITESALMVDIEGALETLNGLHQMGVKISIDDFGTGFSSLAYLRRLPVDEVKIDKSFVQGSVHDPKDAAIVRSVVDLGHHLGLKVVAEGVEEQTELDLVIGLGYDYAQGYLLSRPVSAREIEALDLGHGRELALAHA